MRSALTCHLAELCVEIGARPVGSPANDRAADYIRDCFAALGLAVEEQAYACTGWDCMAARLTIGDEPLPVEANAFSPPCDVTAEAVPAATLEELAAADLTGKIALLHGELVAEPLSAKSWFLRGERDDAIIARLEAGRPAALLAPPPPTPHYEQFTADWELEIPAATAPRPVIERLLRYAGPLRLRLECARRPATARNIVARRPAHRRADAPPGRIVLMAHLDTRINTPGAVDNAAGVAALLALAEALADATLACDLEFVAFNSEEYLPIGDDEYVRRAGEASFADVALAINMDGVGYRGGHNTVAPFNLGPDRPRLPRAALDRALAAEQPLDLRIPRRAGPGVQRRRRLRRGPLPDRHDRDGGCRPAGRSRGGRRSDREVRRIGPARNAGIRVAPARRRPAGAGPTRSVSARAPARRPASPGS